MTCMRNGSLTSDAAPYRVEFKRKIAWQESQTHMLWLVAQENPTEGFFRNGRNNDAYLADDKTLVRTETVWYIFTDENTAFLFKLYFG